MVDLKLRIHPLFFIFGLYFAFIGKVFSFLICTLTACLHELGHYFVSLKCGYKLNRITLMPYGAIISGDTFGLSYKDECKITLAGPMMNLFILVFFVALWWVFPETYAYTDTVVFANGIMLIINLLPCFPLDGGRFLYATLRLKFKRKTAERIVKGLGILFAVCLLVLFVISCFIKVNFTILFFSAFMFVGVFSKNEKDKYIRILSDYSYTELKKPKFVKKVAVCSESKINALYSLIDTSYFYELEIVDSKGYTVKVLKGKALYDFIQNSNPYEKIINELKEKAV